MFSLTREEIMRISQIVISSMHPGNETLKFLKTALWPFSRTRRGYAFDCAEQRKGVKVNIEIMLAFVRLRQMLASNAELARKLEALEKKYDAQFKIVFDAIRQIMAPTETKGKEDRLPGERTYTAIQKLIMCRLSMTYSGSRDSAVIDGVSVNDLDACSDSLYGIPYVFIGLLIWN